MDYDQLLQESKLLKIDTYEKQMTPSIKGLYADNVIFINKDISTRSEKACILAEELGHYHTTSGNILDQQKIANLQREKRARTWAYEKIVPLSKIITAYNQNIENHHELAEFLGVTENFLEKALQRYQEIYGLTCEIGGYIICFEPLDIKNDTTK
ncbi:protein of unknown function [Natribacillus halophilus]|uniref:IrrE N-terminal-like domain-containing protein n=2 Tax=Natribacillus halophilus TaxID=549003 RepID=A0A1G8Q8H8_9BACI|nr:protein of unknown function [Natribacillus halophilus]